MSTSDVSSITDISPLSREESFSEIPQRVSRQNSLAAELQQLVAAASTELPLPNTRPDDLLEPGAYYASPAPPGQTSPAPPGHCSPVAGTDASSAPLTHNRTPELLGLRVDLLASDGSRNFGAVRELRSQLVAVLRTLDSIDDLPSTEQPPPPDAAGEHELILALQRARDALGMRLGQQPSEIAAGHVDALVIGAVEVAQRTFEARQLACTELRRMRRLLDATARGDGEAASRPWSRGTLRSDSATSVHSIASELSSFAFHTPHSSLSQPHGAVGSFDSHTLQHMSAERLKELPADEPTRCTKCVLLSALNLQDSPCSGCRTPCTVSRERNVRLLIRSDERSVECSAGWLGGFMRDLALASRQPPTGAVAVAEKEAPSWWEALWGCGDEAKP